MSLEYASRVLPKTAVAIPMEPTVCVKKDIQLPAKVNPLTEVVKSTKLIPSNVSTKLFRPFSPIFSYAVNVTQSPESKLGTPATKMAYT